MADLLHPERWQAFDANGDPVPGAKAYFYDTGTTTLRTVYADEALTTPHPSPLVADSAGVFAAAYATGTTNVKAVVTKADDSALYTVDPVIKMATALSAAGSVEFAPTATVLATDVQAAIEEVDGNITPAPLSKAAGYTVVLADRNALVNCTASLTLALTAAATLGAGFRVRVRADAGATVTIDPNAAETVNGAATLTLHGGGALELTCTGTAWLAEYLPANMATIEGLARAQGDLIKGGAAAWERLAKGSAAQLVQYNATDVVADYLKLKGIERLAIGSTIRSRNDTTQTTTSTSYGSVVPFAAANVHEFGFIQIGIVTITLEHRVQVGGTSEARVVRIRAGAQTVVGGPWTNSTTTFVARSVDVAVEPGDLVVFQHKLAVAGTSEIRNCRVQTDGGNLIPNGPYAVEGNDHA